MLAERKVPLISEMFEEAKKVGKFRLIASSAWLEYMGVDAKAVAKQVNEVMGLPPSFRWQPVPRCLCLCRLNLISL